MKIVLFLVALLLCSGMASSQTRQDEKSVRAEIDRQTADLWEAGDFAHLEKLSTEYRNSKARTPSGIWKLTQFYDALQTQVSKKTAAREWWEQMESRATSWSKQFPASPSAHLQYAEIIFARAWSVRGNGFSRSLSADQSRGFKEQVARGRAYFDKHKTVAARDPRWYELMLKVATWESWKEDDAMLLINEAVAREPEFWQTYFSAAEYFSPLWNGDAAKLERFANYAANRAGGSDGDALYARIYWWSANRYFKRRFSESMIDCERMMRGVDRLTLTNPDPWNINHFAGFAVSCGDKTRAKVLFSKIGDNPDLDAWNNSMGTFTRFRAWAME